MQNFGYDKATVLTEALPYIQKYHKKTIVVKYGGNAKIKHDLKEAVIEDLVLLNLVGINVVLVHGGGPEINENLGKMNIEPKFVDGLRYTDKATLDVVQMTLSGKTNKDLVNKIEQIGGKAIGLCGVDGGLIQAQMLDDGKYGYVGKIVAVNTNVVTDAIGMGYIPVVATLASGDSESPVYNINADTAAAEIAIALKAEKLILLTDIKGLLRDVKDESSLISTVKLSEVSKLKTSGIISGGMIPKVDCCVRSLEGGVRRTHMIDGRIPHSIIVELLSDAGIGTMFEN